MRRASDGGAPMKLQAPLHGLLHAFILIAFSGHPVLGWAQNAEKNACSKPVYLTFDTGHMSIAPLVAEVLKRQPGGAAEDLR